MGSQLSSREGTYWRKLHVAPPLSEEYCRKKERSPYLAGVTGKIYSKILHVLLLSELISVTLQISYSRLRNKSEIWLFCSDSDYIIISISCCMTVSHSLVIGFPDDSMRTFIFVLLSLLYASRDLLSILSAVQQHVIDRPVS